MQTIEEAAKEFEKENGERIWFSNEQQGTALCVESFKAGVEFAQRWIPVEEELPESDDKVLAKWTNGKVHVNSYDQISGWQYNFDLEITHWRPIELK